MKAIITYRPNAQKTPSLFDKLLTEDTLSDICRKVTGQDQYIVEKDNTTYNRGRLVTIEYNNKKSFVSLSETNINGRNSSLQSVSTAINIYYADSEINKDIYFYFLPNNGENAFTPYHLFYYRLLMTAGVHFLNINKYYHGSITAYNNIDDLIIDRRDNQTVNSSNNSSYVSKSSDAIQIYAKTYGASKYESTILALAVSQIADRPVELFNICEKDLSVLPKSSRKTIEALGNVTLYNTTLFLDKHQAADENEKTKLRSASYVYNLFKRIGSKKCALCGCEITEIIQGAHIWGVSQISHDNSLDDATKYRHAISGNNGLWLCQNHHKLFDSNIIMIDGDGHIRIKDTLAAKDIAFIRSTTFRTLLDETIVSDDFKWYISKRNEELDTSTFQELVI